MSGENAILEWTSNITQNDWATEIIVKNFSFTTSISSCATVSDFKFEQN